MPIVPHSLPPNPSLVAIILIITTRRGPRFVFHYPGIPEPSQLNNSWAFGSIGSDSEDSDDDSDDATSTSDAGETGSRAGSISSTRAGESRAGSLSGKTGRFSAATTSTRRTTRTLREDGPEDEEDIDDDIEALDLNASDSNQGKKENNKNEDGVRSTDKDRVPEWEKLFGYPTEGLEKLLSPADKFSKKKFEVSIEELVFLGYPVFAREDGSWKKRKRVGQEEKKSNDQDVNGLAIGKNPFDGFDQGVHHSPEDLDIAAARAAEIDSPELSPTATRDDLRGMNAMDALTLPPGNNSTAQSYGSYGGMSESTSEMKSVSTASGGQGDDMSMFHLVFVMNPPTLEYHIRVQEMYDNVVKKFSKALKYEQTRSGWVEKEAKKILTLKNQAKESKNPPPMSILWARIIQQSPLAKAIANVYTSIASNKIAHVSIGSTFDASIQIPQAISTPYVATPMEPQLPGLWITTASMLEDDDGMPTLSPHAALLLLEDKETMLKEIEHENNKEMTTPLAYFIRELNPTKSLQKLSASLSLSLADMQFLARHLIYWRRARAVPPLHIRDTYIVSPNCDLRTLSKATTLYSQRFSALPSLPNMLQLLSAKPKQFGYLIPSKDHKAAYMEILAWLLRGGWVTQLRTFAWIKVSPTVKVAVAVQMRKEAAEKAVSKSRVDTTRPDVTGIGKGNVHGSASTTALSARRTYSEDDYTSSNSNSRKSSKSKASPHLEARLSPTSRDRSGSDTASMSSTRTAIPPPSLSMGLPSLPSPALIPLRPSPLHAVDNINPLSPPTGLAGFPSSTSAPDTESLSVASAPDADLATDTTAEPLFSGSTITLPSTQETDYETTLVLSPHKANTIESKWLAHIGSQLEDKELREVWPTLVRYFDGRRAVEEIASREGWKRRTVDELMMKLEQVGCLCVVRHW